jgi:hypothetical protein
MVKTLTYILTTLSFGFSCFGLWAMLNVLEGLSPQSSQALPAFTKLLMDLRLWLLLLPIPVVLYCIYAMMPRSNLRETNATAFVACAMGGLSIVFFPVLLGIFLPCAVLMDQMWSK